MSSLTHSAYRLRFDERDVPSPHASGGAPFGNPRSRPSCKCCRSRLELALELDLTRGELAGACADLTRAPVLVCTACDSHLRPLHYRVTANARSLRIVRHGDGRAFGDDPVRFDRRSVRLEPQRTDWIDAEEPVHQVGGEPFWLREEVAPACSGCYEEMDFLAQLDSDDAAGLQFGDSGILYAFVCKPCRELATFVQE